MLPHPLTNFEIQKYYQNEPKFYGVYSRNNLPEIKDGTYNCSERELQFLTALELNMFQNKFKNL